MTAPTLINPRVAEHLDALVPARHAELVRMEADAARDSFPIIGPAAGQCCYLVTRLIDARSVFELGSGFGYSTAWFARGVIENGGGVVHHTVWDESLSSRARDHLTALNLVDVVSFTISEAIAALEQTDGPFDLIFCDIEKYDYPRALPVMKSRLRSGGVLIADNMFRRGLIFDEDDRSSETEGIREFTKMIAADLDFTSSVVPIRDGLLVARRR